MVDSTRFDVAIKAVIAVLAVSIVALGAYFGWTVYRDRRIAEDATPALRIIRVLKQEVRQKPNDAMLRVRLGEALAAADRTDEAIKQLNAALKIEPKHTGALMDLGQLAMANKRYGTAENYFTQVVDITEGSELEGSNDRREVALYQLGLIALNQKGYEDAVGFFKAALRIRKDASDTYYYLALALDGAGDTDGALQQLQIATAFDPNFGQAQYYLGQMYLRQKDELKAAEHLGLASKADPDAKEPKEALAQFGDPKELTNQATQLLKTDPRRAVRPAALAHYIQPADFDAAVLYARVLEASGDAKGALVAYQAAADIEAGDKTVDAAIKRLSSAQKKK